jgi:hypothetical protein
MNSIRKKIRVKDAWLSSEGLELLYYFEGKETFERLTPLQAAEIMLKTELIQDFCNEDNYLELHYFIDAEYSETGYKAIMKTETWEDFSRSYQLCQFEIMAIAIKIEQRRERARLIHRETAKLLTPNKYPLI